MGWSDPDCYNQPQAFGLTVVGEMEWSEPCWSFDTSVVWKHNETGKFYVGSDAGCSCPMPWESHTSLDDLEGPFDTGHAALATLQKRLDGESEWNREFAASQFANLAAKVMA